MDIKCPFCKKAGRASIERLPKRAHCPKCSKDFILDEGLSHDSIIQVCDTVFRSYNMDPLCEWTHRITERRAIEIESALDKRISWKDVLFAFSDHKNAAYGNLVVLTHSHLTFTLGRLLTREVIYFSYKEIELVEVGNLSLNPCGGTRVYVNGHELSLSICNPVGFQELISKISQSTKNGWDVRCYMDIERLPPEKDISPALVPAVVPAISIAPPAHTGDVPSRDSSDPVRPALSIDESMADLDRAPSVATPIEQGIEPVRSVRGIPAWAYALGLFGIGFIAYLILGMDHSSRGDLISDSSPLITRPADDHPYEGVYVEQVLLPPGGRQDIPTVGGIDSFPLNFTALLAAGYDTESQTLQITFHNGSTYQFFKVDINILLGLYQAKSKGGYFNERIRGAGYNYKRIDEDRNGDERPRSKRTIGDFLNTVKKANGCGDLRIIAKDGTFLGDLTPDRNSDNSVFSKNGKFGDKYSTTSIWNKSGLYGSEYSNQSSFNATASEPPMVYYKGRPVFYLSANNDLSPAMTLDLVLGHLVSIQAVTHPSNQSPQVLVAGNPNSPKKELESLKFSSDVAVQVALAGNTGASESVLSYLRFSSDKRVQEALKNNPNFNGR
jgi:hypothetical protein